MPAGHEVSTEGTDQQRKGRLSQDNSQGLRTAGRTAEFVAAGRSGGNDGLMESMEDRTMKLSGLPPFPQSLEITKCGDFTHSHRTTTTSVTLPFLLGRL